jgi:hypothetical protein
MVFPLFSNEVLFFFSTEEPEEMDSICCERRPASWMKTLEWDRSFDCIFSWKSGSY